MEATLTPQQARGRQWKMRIQVSFFVCQHSPCRSVGLLVVESHQFMHTIVIEILIKENLAQKNDSGF